jgi:hypothetical protein
MAAVTIINQKGSQDKPIAATDLIVGPAAGRLYHFLRKRSSGVFDLREIAFERVGLRRDLPDHVAKIGEKLRVPPRFV